VVTSLFLSVCIVTTSLSLFLSVCIVTTSLSLSLSCVHCSKTRFGTEEEVEAHREVLRQRELDFRANYRSRRDREKETKERIIREREERFNNSRVAAHRFLEVCRVFVLYNTRSCDVRVVAVS
jgi:5-bromo-4-chloroindolyl phosphate hydrolysis protein